jgi:xylono-1,5-lactonase
LETGAISEERIILRFTEKEGWPDGMAIDREGRLWIGFWDGWAIRCYRPHTGVWEAVIELPCSRPTSCCFGGAAFDRLFITTARHGLSETELIQQPLAGSLFVCDPQTSGFATSTFAFDQDEKN